MCALRCPRLRRVSLLMAAAAVAMLLLGFFCVSGEGLQVHMEPGARWTTLPMCLCVVAESHSGMSFQ